MERKKRTIKNSATAVFKFVIKLILQFVLRTIIIYKLGVEYVGLDSLYANIISMLSLAELGIGYAIVFSMYKPAAENDIEKLKTLTNFYKKIYTVITIIITVVGLSIMPFLDFFISGEPKVDVNLKLVYLVFLGNTIISYLGAHKRSLLFVHQRNDIENNILIIQLLLLTPIQSILLLLFENYYLYVIMIPIFTLFEVFVVYYLTNKMYPEIKGKAQPMDAITKKEIIKNIVAASCHQIGSVIVLSTDNILISKFFGLSVLGTISNYILIYNAVHALIYIIVNGMQASVGNLIATTDKEKVYKLYTIFNWVYACISGFCAIALLCLFQPFMAIWDQKSEYVVTIWVVLALVIKFYVTEMRNVTNMFKSCAGLMWEDRFKSVIEAVVNVVASIICIQFLGVAGVFVGTVISALSAPLWVEPYVLHKHYFKKSTKNFFLTYIYYAIITVIIGAITYFICSLLPSSGLFIFIIKIAICCAVPCLLYLIAYFKTNNFKESFRIVKGIFKKKNKTENKDVV